MHKDEGDCLPDTRRRAAIRRVGEVGLAAAVVAAGAPLSASAGAKMQREMMPDFGPNVVVLDPSMPDGEI
ncbi:hypothetical protein, partial [Pseudomonas sp. FW306-2-11AD]